MNNFFVTLTIVLSCWSWGVRSLDYFDCGSLFSISNLRVQGCDDNGRVCNVFIGHNVSVSFDINTGSDGRPSTLKKEVYLDYKGFRFDQTVVPSDPCAILTCPVLSNYNKTYEATVLISRDFRPLQVQLYWIFKTNDDEQVLCFNFPLNVICEEKADDGLRCKVMINQT